MKTKKIYNLDKLIGIEFTEEIKSDDFQYFPERKNILGIKIKSYWHSTLLSWMTKRKFTEKEIDENLGVAYVRRGNEVYEKAKIKFISSNAEETFYMYSKSNEDALIIFDFIGTNIKNKIQISLNNQSIIRFEQESYVTINEEKLDFIKLILNKE